MAVPDLYLKLDGINGEAQDKDHKDWIEIQSFSWGLSNSGTGAVGAGSGASKANLHDLSVSKYADKSTPNLMKFCALGKHIKDGKLSVRKAGGDNPVEYLKYELNEVFISSFQQGGSDGGGIATESVSLNFAKIKLTYTPQKADGSPDTDIPVWYNAKTHEFG